MQVWRRTALLAVLVLMVTGCAVVSSPTTPSFVLTKEAADRAVSSFNDLFARLYFVVATDCAHLRTDRTVVYPLVARDCDTLPALRDAWTAAVTEMHATIAGAPEGTALDLEKLFAVLATLARIAASLSVFV